MATLVIDSKTLPETLSSIIGARRIRVDGDAKRLVLTPEIETGKLDDDDGIDPDDYPDTTSYLNAIPGFVESIREMENAPDSEWEEWVLFTPNKSWKSCTL